MELRNQNGITIQLVNTDNAGNFVFPTPPADAGFIHVVAGRGQMVEPAQNPGPRGKRAEIKLSGVPAIVRVSGPAGTYVVLSTSQVSSLHYGGFPPPFTPTLSKKTTERQFYASTIDKNGSVDIPVRRGIYYIACWRPVMENGKTIFERAPGSGTILVSSQDILEPQSLTTVDCPAP